MRLRCWDKLRSRPVSSIERLMAIAISALRHPDWRDKGVRTISLSIRPGADKSADVLGNLLGLSRRPDRFFEIAHPKMRPVEAHIDGVFIAGCASGPKEIPISIAQGSAAAAKAIRLLQKGFLDLEPTSAYVDPDLCIKCKLCVDVCPQKAISVKSPAYVDEAACKGCGSCAAACPVDAIKMRLFSDEQILAQIRAATEVKKEFPLIIAFLCTGAATVPPISPVPLAFSIPPMPATSG